MPQITVDLTKNADKLFTDVFYQIRKVKTRYLVLRGGAGAGKSYSAHQSELINITRSEHNTLFIRKHGSDIRDSCYKLFNDIISKWRVGELFKCVYGNDNRSITYLETGKKIIFRGIDDPEKLKSIAGIKRIVIEEATQLTFEDFIEIARRARGIEGIQIILIFNPISENHWIKTKMCDVGSPYYDRTTELVFTYKDNKFMLPEDIQELENYRLISENEYRVYVLAEWGVEDVNKKFAYNYSKEKHVKDFTPALIEMYGVPLNPEKIVTLSFDFNVDPITCTAIQHYSGVVMFLRCFKLHNSGTEDLCDHVIAYFPPGTVFEVTGDATGQNRNTMVSDGSHNYTIIQRKFKLQDQQLKIPTKNPDIKKNRVLFNALLRNYEIWIQLGACDPLIYDLTYVEMDNEGNMMKDRTTEKKKADFIDGMRYYFNVEFPEFLQNL